MNAKLAKEVLQKLKEAGFVSAVIHYDGSGDCGQVDELCVFRKGETESYELLVEDFDWDKIAAIQRERDALLRAIPMTIASRYSTFDGEQFTETQTSREGNLYDAMKELAYVWLADTHCGWENNEGAYGEVVIRVDEMLCELEHNQRIIEVSTSLHSFTCKEDGTEE